MTVRVDARGMRCPWPALRLARAMRQAVDDEVVLIADDPKAEAEIATLAASNGWVLLVRDEAGVPAFHVRRGDSRRR